jgi:hypothetical protein
MTDIALSTFSLRLHRTGETRSVQQQSWDANMVEWLPSYRGSFAVISIAAAYAAAI